MKRLLMIIAATVFSYAVVAQPLGHWLDDQNGLPAFSYDGKLPYNAVLSDGSPVNVSDSP